MIDLPFQLIQETEIEKWRAETFWSKEPETLHWINSFKQGATFVDVGANIGIYSLYCVKMIPLSRAIALEASKQNYNRLVENIRLNHLWGRIVPFLIAVADRTDIVSFQDKDSRPGATGGTIAQSRPHTEILFQTSLDSMFAWSLVDPGYGGEMHIKIDVDGIERRIIEGAGGLLLCKFVRSVLVELEKDSEDMAFVRKFMALKDFTENNEFNQIENHSRYRRAREGINVENVIFTRG
jgi:FkbM family methyltransferase